MCKHCFRLADRVHLLLPLSSPRNCAAPHRRRSRTRCSPRASSGASTTSGASSRRPTGTPRTPPSSSRFHAERANKSLEIGSIDHRRLFQTLILNAQNVRMNVFSLPDYSVHNTVAFVPAMSVGSGKVAQVPHSLAQPKSQQWTNSSSDAFLVLRRSRSSLTCPPDRRPRARWRAGRSWGSTMA